MKFKNMYRIGMCMMVMLALGTSTAFAATSIDKCPIYTSSAAIDKKYYTSYKIHQVKGKSMTDYKIWVSTDGGMYWMHESWACGKCGNLILKDSFLGSITDILKDEGETLYK